MFSERSGGFTRFIRIIIDVLNIAIGIACVGLAIAAFIVGARYLWMFPVIFILGAAMNLLTGIKYLMTERTIGGIILLVVAAALGVVAYVTYMSVGRIL